MQRAIRHTLATTAFRFAWATKHTIDTFATFNIGKGVRSPIEILHHMTSVIQYASYILDEEEFEVKELDSWPAQVERFYTTLEHLDAQLSNATFEEEKLMRLIQGPVTDVLTHVGQIAMMSRMNDTPVDKLNYSKAEIIIGKIRGY